jgi:hypothetical protein
MSSRLMRKFGFSASWMRGRDSIAEEARCIGLMLQLRQKTVSPVFYVVAFEGKMRALWRAHRV